MAEPAVKDLQSQNQNITVLWRAYELRPEPVPTLDPNGDYLVSAWQNHVYPLAAKMNMPLKQPLIQPRSRLAHEAAKLADTHHCFEKYSLLLFRAFFEQGKDISDLKILEKLAANLKLDANSLHVSLINNDYTPMVLADEDEAKRIGVRAVPSFVINGKVQAAGVQSTQKLFELLSSNP